MSKIIIIAPAEADDDVKDAVKMLKAQGHDVDTEEPTPKTLLHIVLGLMGPNGYGFGPGYGYIKDDGSENDGENDDDGEDSDQEDVDAGSDDSSGDDFNFESLGDVTVYGEKVHAVKSNSDTSVLCVEKLIVGPKTTYLLNENIISFWPSDSKKPAQRVEVQANNHKALIDLPLELSEGKSVLKVGKDLIEMFKNSNKV